MYKVSAIPVLKRIVSLPYNIPLWLPCSTLPLLQFLEATDIFTVTIVFPLPECHINGIIQYVVFPDWSLSHRNIYMQNSSVFLQGLIAHLLSSLIRIPLFGYAMFTHSLAEGHLIRSLQLWIKLLLALTFVWTFVFKSFGNIAVTSQGKIVWHCKKTAKLSSKVDVPFCMLTSNEWDF